MKKSLSILAIAFIYILLGSKGCEKRDHLPDSSYQKRIERNADSIVKLFCFDEPSAIAFIAFEEDAKIRFSDFLDYLQILSDTGIAPAFSNQACKLISEQFSSDSLTLCFTSQGTAFEKKIRIADLVSDESTFHAGLCVTRPDSVWLSQDFKRINETTFLSALGYKSNAFVPSANCKNYFPLAGSIEFYATKRAKIFGHDTIVVWSVLLGENCAVTSGNNF